MAWCLVNQEILFHSVALVRHRNNFTVCSTVRVIKYRITRLEEAGYLSGMVLGYGLDDRVFESRREVGIFLLTPASRPALEPTEPPIQWSPEALSLGVKRPDREADHSPPSSAEVKNAWSYASTPQCSFMICSINRKHRENFTFTFNTRWVGHVVRMDIKVL
jgi:hypothetical protein